MRSIGGTGMLRSETRTSASNIDVVTGLISSGGGNLVELPNFLAPATPAKGSDGLKLKSKPSKVGRAVTPVVGDILGAAPSSSSSYFGAYYAN